MKKIKPEEIKRAKSLIQRNGGTITDTVILVDGGYLPQKFINCSNPGLSVLGAIDCLVNHAGFVWNGR